MSEEKEGVKKTVKSKTIWVSIITMALGFYKPAGDWVASNPDLFMKVLGGVFLALRFATKGKIDLVDEIMKKKEVASVDVEKESKEEKQA